MIRKALIAVGLALAGMALASCTLSTEGQQTAEKAYDTICRAEPGIYQSFQILAAAKETSAATLAKAAVLHDSITDLCVNRPKDIVTASVLLATAYAKFVAINADVERQRPTT